MSYVKIDEIISHVQSVFKAVIIGAQRAVEIAEEAAQKSLPLNEKATNKAVAELEAGELTYKIKK